MLTYQPDVEKKNPDNAWIEFSVAASIIHSSTFTCIATANNDGNIVITAASFAHHTDAREVYLKVYLMLISLRTGRFLAT